MSRALQRLNPKYLYWSQQGRMVCGAHAPLRGSDTWRDDRWQRMTPAVLAVVAADCGGVWPTCEICGSIPTRVAS